MKPFRAEINQSKDAEEVIVVTLTGDIGHNTIKRIHDTFNQILKGDKHFVVADMSKVNSITSAAIGELMGCRTSLIEKNGDLVFAGMTMDVLETVNALDADKIFTIYKDLRSAINLYYWQCQGQVEEVTLSFPSELSFVPPVRQMVRRITKQKNYSNKDAFRIETIVDEICNNAVEHGSNVEGKEVDVSIAIDRKKIEITITNKSNPEKIESLRKISEYLASPKASFHDKRGRGLALVKMLSNKFQIDSSEIGTCVHVTKLREE